MATDETTNNPPTPPTRRPPGRPRRVTIEPRVYEVGVDISEEQYRSWILAIGDWFHERKPTLTKPVDTAKRYIDACLKGRRPKDPTKVWVGAELQTLEKRILQVCRFDVTKMRPVFTKYDRSRIKKNEKQAKLDKARRARKVDPHLPEEVRVLGRRQATYGDDPTIFLSRKEHERWLSLKQEYVDQFPELSAVSAEAELHFLLDLMILSERQRIKMLNGEQIDMRNYQQVVETIDRIKSTLGIHPNQLAKRVSERREGSFADLLARYESMEDWRKLRDTQWVEELIQIYQMYHQPSPRQDMGGYQLDQVGLLGLTGCMTCSCASCGTRNYAGLSIEQVEHFLESRKVLEVEPTPTADIVDAIPLVHDDAPFVTEADPAEEDVWRANAAEVLRMHGLAPEEPDDA